MECYLLGITTSDSLLSVSPEVLLGDRALGAMVSEFFKYFSRIELLGVSLEFRSSHGLDFLGSLALNSVS